MKNVLLGLIIHTVTGLASPLPVFANNTTDTTGQPSLPDLMVESLIFKGSSFSLVIKNIGAATVPSGVTFTVKGVVVRIRGSHSSKKTFSFSTPALAPGESVVLKGSTSTTSSSKPPVIALPKREKIDLHGDPEHDLPIERPDDPNDIVTIKAHVDSEGLVDESDDTNNTISGSFKVIS